MRALRLSIVLTLAAIVGSVGCFTAPSSDVLFSCEPSGASDCPPGYGCEADGCCHRDGSDVMETFGDCKLGGTEAGGDTEVLESSSGSDSSSSSNADPGSSSDGSGDSSGSSSTSA